MGTPAIANAEIHRLGAPATLGLFLPGSAGEFGDRTGVMAEREQAPFLWTVISQRDSGIVLDDGGAVGEQKIAHGGEIAGVQQIGGALDQAVARRQRLAKLQEARGPAP